MKVERNRAGNKYTFTAEDKEDEKFLDKVNKKIDELEEENKKLKDWNNELIENHKKDIDVLCEENKKLKEDDEELRVWLREKLPLALLKEYMEKFEGVDLKNV